MLHYYSYYKGYTEEQFAADEYFQQWVVSPDTENNHFWQSYLDTHPEQSAIVFKALELVKDLAANNHILQSLSDSEKVQLKESIYQKLDIDLAAYESININRRNRFRTWMAAAVVLAVIVVSFYLFNKQVEKEIFLVQQTGAAEMKEILLADSSVVMLNANSSIRYSNQFSEGADRNVYLEGNAFFKVKKDVQHKPFIVHSGTVSVTVLGTEFNVNARSAAIEVELTKGKVKVAKELKPGEQELTAYLQPGNKVEFDTLNKVFVRTNINARLYSAWTQNNWDFQQTSLEEVAGLIKEYYGVNTVFEKEKSRHLKISALIPVTNLEMLTQVVAKTMHVKIKKSNNQLIVQ